MDVITVVLVKEVEKREQQRTVLQLWRQVIREAREEKTREVALWTTFDRIADMHVAAQLNNFGILMCAISALTAGGPTAFLKNYNIMEGFTCFSDSIKRDLLEGTARMLVDAEESDSESESDM